MEDLKQQLSENVVFAGTELGICVVQNIAAECLKKKPGMSLKNFTLELDTYLARVKVAHAAKNTQPKSTQPKAIIPPYNPKQSN